MLRNPVSETIHFATTPLRGNIFYTEYNVPNWTATIKSAKPYGTNPATVALANSGCNPCHSVSANGSTLIASNWGANNTSVTKVNADGTLTAVANMWNQPSPPAQDSRGFAYSAISPDGTIALQGTNWWGNTVQPGGATQQASAPHGNGSGLTGRVLRQRDPERRGGLHGDRQHRRLQLGQQLSRAARSRRNTNYSVAWTGYVQAIYNETYTFETSRATAFS